MSVKTPGLKYRTNYYFLFDNRTAKSNDKKSAIILIVYNFVVCSHSLPQNDGVIKSICLFAEDLRPEIFELNC